MKKDIFVTALITMLVMSPSYADVTTEPFETWSSPIGSVGIENFQHDRFTGSAVYTIPLEVAPGTNGMQPNPKLSYFSGSGNSIVGNGWSIDVGKITRSARLERPDFDDDDIFILQLNDSVSELVKMGGGEYRTKIESHLRITKSGESWIVEDGSGRRYEFGYSVGSLSYYLTKASDPHGNYIEIDYFSSDFVGYINTITYTKGNGLTQFRTVEFVYENRTDNYPDNSTGRTVRYNKRVDYIDVKVGSDLYKRYDFSYVYSPNSGKSLLRQIDEVGSDGASRLVLAKFDYVNNTTGFSAPQTITNPAPWDITDRYTRIGDVNGDNYPEGKN